ncbi:MAG TPA: NADH-quinone oxidoreductase subunit H [Myxococcota bacterium]|nr:NADH-quinone oxidoreductase subunit H [Myxococcota bacterium]
MASAIVQFAVGLLLAPLLLTVIRRVKAFFGGRHGPTVMQPYIDLAKLARKTPVYSRTTTWVFKVSPVVGMAASIAALSILPQSGVPALAAFPGDFVFLAYVFGMMRFFTVLAALDTGSPFEGMGASREVQFAVLSEVALFSCLIALVIALDATSLGSIFAIAWGPAVQPGAAGILVLVACAMMLILLCENSRIPVDDPTTHLELTMIHEVMVLDHCGLDLAMIEYASALKLWIWSAIVVSLALPVRTGSPWLDLLAGTIGIFILGAVIGVIESIMARLRLLKVPQLLVAACVLALLAVGLGLR